MVAGTLNYDEFRGGLSIRADNILTFEQARGHYAGQLGLKLQANDNVYGFCQELLQTLIPFKGGATRIRFHYRSRQVEGDIVLGEEWRVHPTDELLRRLQRLLGNDNVQVVYKKAG